VNTLLQRINNIPPYVNCIFQKIQLTLKSITLNMRLTNDN